jgi:hypothetical protein
MSKGQTHKGFEGEIEIIEPFPQIKELILQKND